MNQLTCPACLSKTRAEPLEAYFDPIGEVSYSLYLCENCGTTFSDPRTSPGPAWYARFQNQEKANASDWRYLTFLKESGISGRILDVGCGNGQFLLMAKSNGFKTSGFDFSSENIRQAAALGLDGVRQDDFSSLKKEPECPYDAATLFDVLEHAPEPGELLSDLNRCLKVGGFLAISVPNGDRPRLGLKRREGFDYPPFHFTRWTSRSMERALAAAGFEAVHFKFSPLPFRFFSGLIYGRLLEISFPYLKKIIFGRAAQTRKTWTDLLQKSEGPMDSVAPAFLKNPSSRQKIINAGLGIFSLAFSPIEIPAILYARKFRPRQGCTLYCLAKKVKTGSGR